MKHIPTHLYVGPRAAVIAEAGAKDFYPGKYLAQPLGAVDFIPDDCATRAELHASVKQWKRDVPNIKVVWL